LTQDETHPAPLCCEGPRCGPSAYEAALVEQRSNPAAQWWSLATLLESTV
jgi:hypothetical protein